MRQDKVQLQVDGSWNIGKHELEYFQFYLKVWSLVDFGGLIWGFDYYILTLTLP